MECLEIYVFEVHEILQGERYGDRRTREGLHVVFSPCQWMRLGSAVSYSLLKVVRRVMPHKSTFGLIRSYNASL